MKQKRLPKRLARRKSRSESASARLRKYDAGNAQTEAEAEEGAALEAGTLIDAAHLRDGAAEIVIGTSLRGETSIRTFPPVLLAEAVGPLDPPIAHVHARDP